MRTCYLPVLAIALAGPAAADACFLKCFCKSAPAPEAVRRIDTALPVLWMQITSVAGQSCVGLSSVPGDVDSSRDVDVIVDANFDPTGFDPTLVLTDFGLATPSPVTAAAAPRQREYKHPRIRKKTVAAAATGVPTPTPDPTALWEMTFTIPRGDLLPGHNYTVSCKTSNGVQSNTVSFHTAPTSGEKKNGKDKKDGKDGKDKKDGKDGD
ncbi:MAG TPA: hypothetical protein VKE40_18100 [Gemmataceae bacterium]|nr:hypothetical protein [Gemmataceae bacterium]